MNSSSIDITEHYFELSNQGNLTEIEKQFHPQATYSSANTGLYYGIPDIMSMMRKFFAEFQSLHWQIDAIKSNSTFITEVGFTCHSTDMSGSKTTRHGIERLVVVDGLIRHIEVR